jgi:PPK2 family polyphosphate:nucleotide phosphotransferase
MKKIDLSRISTKPPEDADKKETLEKHEALVQKLSEIQNKLYAQQKYSVLIIIQGMDASGKDGAIKSVFSGVNPAGCNVKSFKVPTPEEAAHHFLWRINKECPPKGMMMIFNRSQYEEILESTINKTEDLKKIDSYYDDINAFEKSLVNDHTIMLKFYLHVSHGEQLKRLKERKTDEHKRWKYQKGDVKAIKKHKEYKRVYEKIFERCSAQVPWHIVPADKNWYKNYSILSTIVKKLQDFDIQYPKIKL